MVVNQCLERFGMFVLMALGWIFLKLPRSEASNLILINPIQTHGECKDLLRDKLMMETYPMRTVVNNLKAKSK